MPFKVGAIIDGRIPDLSLRRLQTLGVGSLWRGSASQTGAGLMRWGWIADEVNRHPEWNCSYELYRPFRRYDLLVFVKSMGSECQRLAQRQLSRGRCVFDINVNYFDTTGTFYYEGMQPTAGQSEDARRMATICDGVMAASGPLRDECARLNARVERIPDNVNLRLVPPPAPWRPDGLPLRLLWSGQPHKLFDLLVVADTLRRFKSRIQLVLVTNALSALDLVYEPYRGELQRLLADVPTQVVTYESAARLLEIYALGGVLISPRFLDSAYNQGHTEWKITLGMACGRIALCSPVPSYVQVADLSGGLGIRICRQSQDWESALEAILTGTVDWEAESEAARRVVVEHYATAVVAEKHAGFLRQMLGAEVG